MSNNYERSVSHTSPVTDDNSNGNSGSAANRRRASQIVHDERGNARVEWIDAGHAGVDLERAPLSVEPTPARGEPAKLAVERARAGGFDPYARVGAAGVPAPKKQPVKRDLRKLGEWIKLKRELEARKSSGDDPTPNRPRIRADFARSREAFDVCAACAHYPSDRTAAAPRAARASRTCVPQASRAATRRQNLPA